MKKRKPDTIDVRVPGEGAAAPTPEQMQHADYVEQPIYDRSPQGRVSLMGKAFKRVPRFESIEGLTVDQLRALRAYRTAFDEAEMSETKSALDIRPRGTGSDNAAIMRLEMIAFASIVLARLEAGVPGPLLPVLRAVAGRDMDFKAIAIARYGSRQVQRVDASKRKARVSVSIEPRSNRHRTIVRDEFIAAADSLVAAAATVEKVREAAAQGSDASGSLAPPVASSCEEAVGPLAQHMRQIDPAFIDKQGYLRSWADIADIIRGKVEGDPM